MSGADEDREDARVSNLARSMDRANAQNEQRHVEALAAIIYATGRRGGIEESLMDAHQIIRLNREVKPAEVRP